MREYSDEWQQCADLRHSVREHSRLAGERDLQLGLHVDRRAVGLDDEDRHVHRHRVGRRVDPDGHMRWYTLAHVYCSETSRAAPDLFAL